MPASYPDQIARQIRQAIVKGDYTNGSRLQPERDLCVKYEASRGTIRSAIAKLENEGIVRKIPRQGTVVTHEAVESADTDTDTSVESIMFPRFCTDTQIQQLTCGMLEQAGAQHEQIMVTDANANHVRFLEAITNPPKDVRGIIFVPFEHDDYRKATERLLQMGIKVLFVGTRLRGFEVSSIGGDNYSGAHQATDHLIRMHDCPVYHVSEVDQPSSVHDRFRGWRDCMTSHGFCDCEQYLCKIDKSVHETSLEPQFAWRPGYDAVLPLLQKKQGEKICIFTSNDFGAQGVYRAAEECGLTVGKDVFLVGFDGLPFCERMRPQLSSIQDDCYTMGFEAAKLMRQILDGDVRRPINKVLPVQLKVRESSTGGRS